MPGAAATGTPTADLSRTGDTLFTNAFVDNVLGTQEGFILATALLYANGRDLKDPRLSPIYGNVTGFPPTILTSGTRDLYLSHTVRGNSRKCLNIRSCSRIVVVNSHICSRNSSGWVRPET
jgi:hypothetical protein